MFGNFDEANLSEKFNLLSSSNINFIHTEEVVNSNDKPSFALRAKKQSSMRQLRIRIKEHKNIACVSAGNTGALLGIARFVLKTLPGVSKPAICGVLPGLNKVTRVLDLGANMRVVMEDTREVSP